MRTTHNLLYKVIHKVYKNEKHLLIASSIFSLILIVITLIAVMVYTNRSIYPHTSELAFIEKSFEHGVEGSVIPASCESNPPTNHFFGDCQDIDQCSSGQYTVSTFQCWYMVWWGGEGVGSRFRGLRVTSPFTSLSEIVAICNNRTGTIPANYGQAPTFYSFEAEPGTRTCISPTPCVKLGFSPLSPCTNTAPPSAIYQDLGEVFKYF